MALDKELQHFRASIIVAALERRTNGPIARELVTEILATGASMEAAYQQALRWISQGRTPNGTGNAPSVPGSRTRFCSPRRRVTMSLIGLVLGFVVSTLVLMLFLPANCAGTVVW